MIERLIMEVLVPRGLQLGGSLVEAYVAKRGTGSATEEDMAAVRDWFSGQKAVVSFDVGPLSDAWYSDPADWEEVTHESLTMAEIDMRFETLRNYCGMRFHRGRSR